MGAGPTSKLERRLLAALLVYRGSVVSEDRLIDCVWPESPPSSASNSLQSKISRLRRLVGPEQLTRVGSGYELRCASSDCDADRFDDLVLAAETMPVRERVPVFEEALDLWNGPAFGEFGDELFALSSSTALTQRRLEVEQRAAEGLIELGDFSKALQRADQLLEADPFREAGWQVKMKALSAAGRSVEALRVYQEAHEFFVEETGLDPSPRLRATESEILEALDPSTPVAQQGSTAGRSPARSAPLVGGSLEGDSRRFDLPLKRPDLISRRSVSAALRGALGAADNGRPSIIYIEGVEGIGKTRLVDSIAAAARSDGWQVLSGRCLPDLELPLGPIGQLISSLGIARSADLAADAGSSNVALAVLEMVRQITTQRSVVVIEDAHWGDPGFCSALELMAAELESIAGPGGAQTLLIVTSRPPDGDGVDVGDRLRRNPITQLVTPTGLEESDVSELVRSMSGLRPSGRSAARLRAASGGVPGAVVRILERLRADGQLLVRAGCLDMDVDVTSLQAIEVSERPPENWNETSNEVRVVLGLLAVSGILTVMPTASVVAVVASALGLDDSRARDVLEEARHAGLLRRRGALGFRNERTRAYVSHHSSAQSLGPALVALAEGLETSPASSNTTIADPFPDVMVHVLEAAESMGMVVDQGQLRRWRLAAADRNFAVSAFERSASYLEPLVRQLEPGDMRTLEDGTPIDLAYGIALHRAHDEFRAQSVLEEVALRLSAIGDTTNEVIALSAICRIAVVLSAHSDLPISAASALHMLREFAERTEASDPRSSATAYGLLVEQASVVDNFEAAESDLDVALRLTGEDPDERPAEVDFAAGLLWTLQVDLDRARRHLEASLKTADAWVSSWSLGRLCLVEIMSGQLPAARNALDRAMDAQRQLGIWSELALTQALEASYFASCGEFESALEHTERTEAAATRAGSAVPLLFSLPIGAFCHAQRGAFDDAREALQRLDTMLGRPQWQYAALLALAEDDLGTASALVKDRMGRVRSRPSMNQLAVAIATLATCSEADGELPVEVSRLSEALQERGVRFAVNWPVDIAQYWTSAGGSTP